MKNPKKALVIVDVQNDFCPGGALAVPDGDKVVPVINRLSPKFDKVIASQDWHPKNHVSFKTILWPDHCIQGTPGAAFHKDLNLKPVNLIIRKGINPEIDSYSVFIENDRKTETGLHYYLKGLKIKDIYFCGLATDYCVYYSAVDAKKFGFNSYVIIDASRGIDVPRGNVNKAVNDMKSKGVKIINENEILHCVQDDTSCQIA